MHGEVSMCVLFAFCGVTSNHLYILTKNSDILFCLGKA